MANATISAFNIGFNWPTSFGTSGILKIISDREFVTGGFPYPAGRVSDPIDQNFCYQAAITVVSDVATVAAIVLPQTDAVDVQVVNGSGTPLYTAIIYSNGGDTKRQNLFQGWHLSASLGTSFSFATWTTDNNAPTASNPRSSWVDTDTLNRAILAGLNAPASTTQNGIGRVSVTPADTAHPTFVGDNDPRLASLPVAIINVKAAPYSAIGNGVADDSVAIQAAITAASLTTGSTVYFPTGTYRVTKQGAITAGVEYALLLSSPVKIQLVGEGAKITFVSSTLVANPCHAIVVNNGGGVTVDGLEFQGTTTDNDLNTNLYCAMFTRSAVTDIAMENCITRYCAPLQASSSNSAARWLFNRNKVFNAPNSLTTANSATISDNWFVNDAYVSTRSHAIYIYGGFSDFIISGNHFYQITGHGCKLKGNGGAFERKLQQVINNNNFNQVHTSAVELGSDSELTHALIVVNGNTMRNCKNGVQVFAAQEAVVANNTISYDWQAAETGGSGVVIVGSGIGSPGAIATIKGIQVSGNTIENNAQWISQLTFTGLPSVGQTIVVGAITYTFVAGAPASAIEVQIGATATLTAENFANQLRGRNTTWNTMNAILADPCDVVYDSETALVVINGTATYTLTNGASNVTTTMAVTDYRGVLVSGVKVQFAVDPITVQGNYIKNAQDPIDISNSVRPRIINNTVEGWVGSTPFTTGLANAFSEWSGNYFFSTPASTVSAVGILDVRDGFPTVRNNFGATTLNGSITTSFWPASVVTAGDGKARNVMWFGEDSVGGVSPYTVVQSLPLTWRDGDTVNVNDNVGNSYTFTFKRTAPGANEFNSRASLVTLIDATAEFEATTIGNQGYQYILVKFATVGTAGNAATLTVTTKAKTCGITLGTLFAGGAATAIKTVIFSPLANDAAVPSITSANSAATALTGVYINPSDTKVGHAYVITHSAAGGTEQFGYVVNY